MWLRAVSRLGLVCRGTVYLLVGYLALRLALAARGRRGAPPGSAGAVQAVSEPVWGRVGWKVGRRSVRLDFRERFIAAHMSRALATLIRVLGGLGCAARAVVFVLAGFFIVKAAMLSSSGQVKGLDAVFRTAAGSAGGSWLLGVLASGLVCYGLYCLFKTRYRDLTPGR